MHASSCVANACAARRTEASRSRSRETWIGVPGRTRNRPDGIRTAMLFVRNPTGVSHSPDEWASADDCLAGVAALADVVTDLAGAGA